MFKLMIVDDEPGIRFSVRQVFAADPDEVVVLEADNSDDAVRLLRDESPDVVLLDIRLGLQSGLKVFDSLREVDPRCVVIFITGHGTAETAIEAMRKGAYDYLLKPLDATQLRDVVHQARDVSRAMRQPALLKDGDANQDSADMLVGSSAVMRQVFKQIGRVASQDDCVLFTGEVGTGKELAARAVYQHSQRREGPFLIVNCLGRTQQQLEGAMFGYEAGAFPEAERRRIGKLEQATGGTLLLDEISELPLDAQARLLRVLEHRQFERIGSTETLASDVRILASSSQNLETLVESGRFRKDLYFRLRGMLIQLPPLREHPSDIPELAHYFLFRFNRQLGTAVHSISEEALERLQCYSWPGNVRELQSVIREALIRSSGPVLLPEFLPAELLREADIETIPEADPSVAATWEELAQNVETWLKADERGMYRRALRLFDRILVSGALKRTHGNQAVAAELLGLSRPTLRGKIRIMRRDYPETE
jgi:two-component system, NtrC family, nitrogen regulation response regulator GlnG